jgi:uncharacterized membrane protein
VNLTVNIFRMIDATHSAISISSLWEVLLLFLIPIGGGIPAGVLLAKNRGFDWQMMVFIYFISDVILASLFEPMVILIRAAGQRFAFVGRINVAFKKSMDTAIAKYGINPGPFRLVMVAFGVDPMTGRTAALAAGHGFLSGWTLAILGDMIFFIVLMVSTLFLNNVLGDGTWTAVIIMALMLIIPALVRRVRNRSVQLKH